MKPENIPNHIILEYNSININNIFENYTMIKSFYHDKRLKFPIGMHKHLFYEINIIVEGCGYHYIENRCFDAKKGSVFVIPPNIKHGYYTDDENNFKILNIIINLEFFERYKQELSNIKGYSTLFEIEPFLRQNTSVPIFLRLDENQLLNYKSDFDELVKISDLNDHNSNIIKISKVLYIICKFSDYISESHNSVIMEKNDDIYSISIVQAMEYINKYYYQKITIDKLCKIANMSKSTFIRYFKLFCKETPINYINYQRVVKSTDMLKYTDYSITKIAQDCGFFDSSHFCKNFLSIEGCLPLFYRKHHK